MAYLLCMFLILGQYSQGIHARSCFGDLLVGCECFEDYMLCEWIFMDGGEASLDSLQTKSLYIRDKAVDVEKYNTNTWPVLSEIITPLGEFKCSGGQCTKKNMKKTTVTAITRSTLDLFTSSPAQPEQITKSKTATTKTETSSFSGQYAYNLNTVTPITTIPPTTVFPRRKFSNTDLHNFMENSTFSIPLLRQTSPNNLSVDYTQFNSSSTLQQKDNCTNWKRIAIISLSICIPIISILSIIMSIGFVILRKTKTIVLESPQRFEWDDL